MDIIDCLIKDLPSKGGRFSNIKRTYKHYVNDDRYETLRSLLRNIENGSYYYYKPLVMKELLVFLISEKRIKL